MTEGLVTTFENSLDELGVGRCRTSADGIEEALSAEAEPPVVGAPFPFERISLPDWVTTAPTSAELREATTGVTAAGAGIAEYGTVVIQSRLGGDEPVSLYPERHVAVLRERDLVAGISEAIEWLGDEFDAGRSSAVLASGTSATSDMGALVHGVHGPRDVRVIVVTDP